MNESRRGFIWFLVVNILVCPLYIFIAIQVATTHPPTVFNALMMTSGARTVTAAELVRSVKMRNRSAYWINARAGDIYTDNSSQIGIDQISYLPKSASPSNLSQFDLRISTYANAATYDAQLHPLAGIDNITVTTANGVNIEYNKASLDHAYVTFAKKPEIVIVDYPTLQSISTLINDAKRLVLVN